jgi:hypothetical protein
MVLLVIYLLSEDFSLMLDLVECLSSLVVTDEELLLLLLYFGLLSLVVLEEVQEVDLTDTLDELPLPSEEAGVLLEMLLQSGPGGKPQRLGLYFKDSEDLLTVSKDVGV